MKLLVLLAFYCASQTHAFDQVDIETDFNVTFSVIFSLTRMIWTCRQSTNEMATTTTWTTWQCRSYVDHKVYLYFLNVWSIWATSRRWILSCLLKNANSVAQTGNAASIRESILWVTSPFAIPIRYNLKNETVQVIMNGVASNPALVRFARKLATKYYAWDFVLIIKRQT